METVEKGLAAADKRGMINRRGASRLPVSHQSIKTHPFLGKVDPIIVSHSQIVTMLLLLSFRG